MVMDLELQMLISNIDETERAIIPISVEKSMPMETLHILMRYNRYRRKNSGDKMINMQKVIKESDLFPQVKTKGKKSKIKEEGGNTLSTRIQSKGGG